MHSLLLLGFLLQQFWGFIDHFLSLVERQGVLELLCEVLVDGLAALQDGPSVLEALNLLEDQADRVDFVFPSPVD
jgi:hypothetical protein